MMDGSVARESGAVAARRPGGLGGVRALAARGSVIEIIGYFLNQGLRLATNMILSRLLFPEAYGLTAIVTVFMVALGMLTDVGLRDSIIANDRGDDPDFLNTAWTIQIVRGFALWAVAALVAWPVAWLYRQPELFPLIAVSGLGMAIHGFGSTKAHTLSRHLRRGSLLVVEVGAKVVSMGVMFAWAWIWPSVWSLVVGGIVQTAGEVVGSHLLSAGYQNRLRWDRSAAKTIQSFGKWIFGSSAFTFLAGEGDRILLGRFLTLGTLGVYSVAGLLSSAVGQIVNRLTGTVFFGLFSRVAREEPSEVGKHYYAARLKLDLLAMPALGAVVVLGPSIVRVLYDPRYQDAGWMMQFLCIRVGLQCVLYPCGVCLIAINQPRHQLFANAGRFLAVWIGIPVGYHLAGLDGVLWATTISEIPMLIVFWTVFARLGYLRLSRELVAPLAALGGALAAILLKFLLGQFFPLLRLAHG